jgi:hypothetical protein
MDKGIQDGVKCVSGALKGAEKKSTTTRFVVLRKYTNPL